MAALPLSFLTILIALYSFQLSPTSARLGGWNPIKNLADPEVMRVAKFAVKEYNMRANDLNLPLKFVRAIKGEIQVVNGFNYRLVIAAHYTGKSTPNNFETVVYQKADQNRTLTFVSFKKLLTEN